MEDMRLVKEFVKLQSKTEAAVAKKDFSSASSSYHALLEKYHEIHDADVDDLHKNIAYDQLSKVHAQVAELKVVHDQEMVKKARADEKLAAQSVSAQNAVQGQQNVQSGAVASGPFTYTQTITISGSAPPQLYPLPQGGYPQPFPLQPQSPGRPNGAQGFARGGFSQRFGLQQDSKKVIVGAGALLMVLAVLFVNPAIIGFAVVEHGGEEIFTKYVGSLVSQNRAELFVLSGVPTALALTGRYNGRGSFSIYLEQPEGKLLVLDSAHVNGTSFIASCVDTCALYALTHKEVTLVFDVQDADLFVETVDYIINPAANTMPQRRNHDGVIVVPVGQEVSIDLNRYYEDSDGDLLLFSYGVVSGADVVIDDTDLVVRAAEAGNFELNLVVSDGKSSMEDQIVLSVQ